MSNDIHLTPDYISLDFLSAKEKLINLMRNTDTFKDYNYEGANVTMLLELVSYITDLTSFYVNEVAKNVYPDTANIYETTHSLVSQRGYQPNGYISADVELMITVKRDSDTTEFFKENDQLYIPAWYPLDTGQKNIYGDKIIYSTTSSYTYTVPSSGDIDEVSFLVPVKQGTPFTVSYNGQDIVDGAIVLPFKKFDTGTFPYREDLPSLLVFVNEEPWTRVSDFYDELSGLGVNDNVYKFVYDKYGRYNIQFSTARNMPNSKSRVRVILMESLGVNGTLGANLLIKEMADGAIMSENVPVLIDRNWSIVDTPFMKNLTQNIIVDGTQLGITNPSASVNGSDPETILEIKENSKKVANAQSRNVTKYDYIGDLEKRSDIIKANVWGEQEENRNNVYDYNKVYISVVPRDWTMQTIATSAHTWIDPMVPNINQVIDIPYEFNELFEDDLKRYLEPKKILSTYEEFIVPNLVYFKFEIGILPKRMYNFNNISSDVRNKLAYYFESSNRAFNEVIDFRDIHNFILDTTITTSTNKFENVRGIQNLVFRDIALYASVPVSSDPMEIFQLNDDKNYPMFSVQEYDVRYDNLLKPIKLGLNQFPALAKDMCIFVNEA